MIASTDLSHYFDANTARRLDARVLGFIERFDPDGLLAEFTRYPESERGRSVGCGVGPAIAVMIAARGLGARQGHVLRYANSGDVSGDYDAVVGYVAAAMTI
jgi:AmmeMemoRadiSam system protein B